MAARSEDDSTCCHCHHAHGPPRRTIGCACKLMASLACACAALGSCASAGSPSSAPTCVWRDEESKCGWHLMYPFGVLAGSRQAQPQAPALGPLDNDLQRRLLWMAYALQRCAWGPGAANAAGCASVQVAGLKLGSSSSPGGSSPSDDHHNDLGQHDQGHGHNQGSLDQHDIHAAVDAGVLGRRHRRLSEEGDGGHASSEEASHGSVDHAELADGDAHDDLDHADGHAHARGEHEHDPDHDEEQAEGSHAKGDHGHDHDHESDERDDHGDEDDTEHDEEHDAHDPHDDHHEEDGGNGMQANCAWQHHAPSPSTFAAGLLGTAGSPAAGGMCLPANIDGLLADYLALLSAAGAAGECAQAAGTAEQCSAAGGGNGRCTFAIHGSGDTHCVPNPTYVLWRLSSTPTSSNKNANASAAGAALAQAAQRAQAECSPETTWQDDGHGVPAVPQPAPLSREACIAKGTFDLAPATDLITQWAEASSSVTRTANVTSTSVPTAGPSTPVPTPGSSAGQAAPAAPVALAAPAGCPPAPECPPPLPAPTCACETAPPLSPSGLRLMDPSDATPLVAAPSCQLAARNLCVPTLLAMASAGSGVVASAQPAGRELMSALVRALDCIHQAQAGQQAPIQEASAASTTGCTAQALAGSAAAAYNATVAPTCARLGAAQCMRQPGCALQMHGGHTDCVRSRRYVAEALGGGELAEAVQKLADTCRDELGTCGQQRVTITRAMAGALARAMQGPAEASQPLGQGPSAPAPASPPALVGVGVLGGDGQGMQQGADEHAEEEEGDAHEQADGGDDSLALRIGAVFAVLGAGIIGACLPLVFKGALAPDRLLTCLVRSFSTGVVLVLALLHVAMHAIEELDGLVEAARDVGSRGDGGHVHRLIRRRRSLQQQAGDAGVDAAFDDDGYVAEEAEEGGGAHDHPYPMGMTVVVFGFLFMVLLDHVCNLLRLSRQRKQLLQASGGKQQQGDAVAADGGNRRADHAGDGSDVVGVKPSEIALTVGEPAHSHAHDHTRRGAGAPVARPLACHAGGACGIAAAPAGHAAVDGSRGGSGGLLEPFRLALLAYFFELGCIFHSFIIGLSLGTTTPVDDVRPLMTVLCFHQAMEGISLGTVLLQAGFGAWKRVAMVLTYALTCPAGIAIGIGIASSYNAKSTVSRAVQGTLNGVSAGMLLYLCMGMVLEEHRDAGRGPGAGAVTPAHNDGDDGAAAAAAATRHEAQRRLLSFSALVLGAAAFAVLAEWA